MTKPNIREVREVLRRHRALVVHFSSEPRLDRTDIHFPDDLTYALEHPDIPGGLCCSVVKPNDTRANTFGSVGLIFDLRTEDSLIAVSRGDGGAVLGTDGIRDFDPRYKDFDLAALEASIIERARDSHNEWGVKDYVVRGLFVLPGNINVVAPNDRRWTVPLNELHRLFEGQRLYSFGDNEVIELHPRNGQIRVDHSEIYR